MTIPHKFNPLGISRKKQDAGVDYFELLALATGDLYISTRWGAPLRLYKNGSYVTNVSPTVVIPVVAGDVLTVEESIKGATFRAWVNNSLSFVFGTACKLVAMPDMNRFTTTPAGTTVGNYFFNNFNSNGALIALPAGSFDTSNITTVGTNFFNNFNSNGRLTKGSNVSIKNITPNNITAYYWNGASTYSEIVAPGEYMTYASS